MGVTIDDTLMIYRRVDNIKSREGQKLATRAACTYFSWLNTLQLSFAVLLSLLLSTQDPANGLMVEHVGQCRAWR